MRPTLVISGAHLAHPYVGIGTYTLRLIRGLAQADQIDFKVLLPRSAEKAVELIPPGCHVWVEGRPPLRYPIATGLYWSDRITATAIRNYPQAIFHSTGSFWSLRRPARTAVTLHDSIYRRFPEYLGRWFVRRQLAYAAERYAARSQVVFTVSQSAAADLRELAGIPAEKIHVIYNWVGPSFNPAFAGEEAPRVRAKYRLPDRFLLYVGGYDYRKNVEFLIAGYAEAKRRGLHLPLVLAGKIPSARARTLCDVAGALRRAGLHHDADIFLPGFIEDSDLPGLYGACHALVYPSLYEGFGLPPLEAIASGRPALVADNSSLKEIVPNARNRFSMDNPAVLADLLLAVQDSPSDFFCAHDPRFTQDYAIAAYLKVLSECFP